MSTKSVKVIIIDEDMNSIRVDMDQWLFERLRIKKENIKINSSKSALNREVTDFLNSSSKD